MFLGELELFLLSIDINQIQEVSVCPEEDLNLHGIAPTSSWN